MTSSDNDLIETEQANVISSEEIASAYERWEAPTMVSVSDIEESQLKIPTAKDVEAIRKAAQEDGYKDGFEKGLHDGTTAGQTQIQQHVSDLTALISTLNSPLMAIEEVIEQQVITLTTLLTRQVVMSELKMVPESVVNVFNAALAQLPLANRKLKIRIHPDDLQLVQKGLTSSDQSDWQWLEDATLSRGGLDIESIDTHIDATVETRIKSAIEKLLGEEEQHAE